MKKLLFAPLSIMLVMALVLMSCNKDEEEEATTGHIEGVVIDIETTLAVADVRIIVFDANTNSPIGETYTTNEDGSYKIELEPGIFYLKLYSLGYESIPQVGMTALPLTVEKGQSLVRDFQLTPSDVVDGGVISGKVEKDDQGVGGVLVIAENSTSAFSSVSDVQGNYIIYNVPVGDYSVAGWITEHSSSVNDISVIANSELEDVNILLANDGFAAVTGTISFLAVGNKEIDVSLVHPLTKETIPGLSTRTVGGSYQISNVDLRTYVGRASYENDGLVLDPDWIVKNGGDPTIEVMGGGDILNFSVTGAVSLISPTNDSTSTQPVDVSLDTLSFSWNAYSSSSDYVIEVMNANGNIIWGGFTEDWSQKNITIPSSQTSIEYNSDGSAKESLEVGKTYRWRIFASKDDKQSTTGWRLISVSEDQMGLITIVE